MTDPDVTRRLAAILAADVVGYSRMMGADEAGTLAALREIWRGRFNPCIAEHNGRIVKMIGDGALVEFASVVDAVSCARDFQNAIAARNDAESDGASILFRIGINLGDIVLEDGDIFGDGVNIAARLEAQAPPGGALISDSVHSQIAGRVGITFSDIGEQNLKNIARPVRCWRWDGTPEVTGSQAGENRLSESLDQKIHFCTSFDGVEIAYATSGSGPPLVRAPHWMSHLEFDWQTPVWRHTLEELSREHTLVRFDQRANGLSDWDVNDISFESSVKDLAAVVMMQGWNGFPCSVSPRAVRFPLPMRRSILNGSVI